MYEARLRFHQSQYYIDIYHVNDGYIGHKNGKCEKII